MERTCGCWMCADPRLRTACAASPPRALRVDAFEARPFSVLHLN